MFVQFFQEFFSVFVSQRMANMLAEPMAVFTVLTLVLLAFGLFANQSHKKVYIITICVIAVILSLFAVADNYGFVQLPIVSGVQI